MYLLLTRLRAGQPNLGGIHHHDEVAGVHVRRERRPGLAAQHIATCEARRPST
jgi:hypothetical protein